MKAILNALHDGCLGMICFLFFRGEALSCECSNALDESSAETVFVGKLSIQKAFEFQFRVDENGEKLEGDAGKEIYGAILMQNYFRVLEKQEWLKELDDQYYQYILVETGAGICDVRLKVGKKYKIYLKDYFSFSAGQAKRCEFKAVPLEE